MLSLLLGQGELACDVDEPRLQERTKLHKRTGLQAASGLQTTLGHQESTELPEAVGLQIGQDRVKSRQEANSSDNHLAQPDILS
ncbi:hypothetical protein COCON_G00131550 [Conger conger]|uniref:Uncharacterized protein n=1 Tax=Conger conger TaxID=82655 RepID=A0A9Q1HVI6_CONCO|nr:hypothetical protein COCON_G00131550 [Conger conger]